MSVLPRSGRLLAIALPLTTLACGDSTGPPTVTITEPVPLDALDVSSRYYGLTGGLADNGAPRVTPVMGASSSSRSR